MTTAPMGGPIKPISAGGPERSYSVSPSTETREQYLQTPDFAAIQMALGSGSALRISETPVGIDVRIVRSGSGANLVEPCQAEGSREALVALGAEASAYLGSLGIHMAPIESDKANIDYGFLNSHIGQGGLAALANNRRSFASFHAFGQGGMLNEPFIAWDDQLENVIAQVVNEAKDVICG